MCSKLPVKIALCDKQTTALIRTPAPASNSTPSNLTWISINLGKTTLYSQQAMSRWCGLYLLWSCNEINTLPTQSLKFSRLWNNPLHSHSQQLPWCPLLLLWCLLQSFNTNWSTSYQRLLVNLLKNLIHNMWNATFVLKLKTMNLVIF